MTQTKNLMQNSIFGQKFDIRPLHCNECNLLDFFGRATEKSGFIDAREIDVSPGAKTGVIWFTSLIHHFLDLRRRHHHQK